MVVPWTALQGEKQLDGIAGEEVCGQRLGRDDPAAAALRWGDVETVGRRRPEDAVARVRLEHEDPRRHPRRIEAPMLPGLGPEEREHGVAVRAPLGENGDRDAAEPND